MNKEMIKEIVEQHYQLKLDTNTRKREYIEARSIYYKLLRDKTRLPLSHIGETLNKDHATVLHSLRNLKDWLEYDKQIKTDYLTILERIDYAISVNPDEFYSAESLEGFYEKEYKVLKQKYNFLKTVLKKYEPNRIENFD